MCFAGADKSRRRLSEKCENIASKTWPSCCRQLFISIKMNDRRKFDEPIKTYITLGRQEMDTAKVGAGKNEGVRVRSLISALEKKVPLRALETYSP